MISSNIHPYIHTHAYMFRILVLPPSVCILLELCEFGSLADVLKGIAVLRYFLQFKSGSHTFSTFTLSQEVDFLY